MKTKKKEENETRENKRKCISVNARHLKKDVVALIANASRVGEEHRIPVILYAEEICCHFVKLMRNDELNGSIERRVLKRGKE